LKCFTLAGPITMILRNVGNYSPVDELDISEDLSLQQPHLEDS